MKKVLIAIFALALLGAGAVIAFSANAGRQATQRHGTGSCMTCANVQAPTVTITGTVKDITAPQAGQLGPEILTVVAGTETHQVMVAPAGFLPTLKLSLKSGDQITLTGWSITCQDQPMVVARDLTMAGKTYTLRDASGKPVWAGNRSSATACDPANCQQSCPTRAAVSCPAKTGNTCPSPQGCASCPSSSGCCGGASSTSNSTNTSGASQ